MRKKYVIAALGVIILAGAYFGYKKIQAGKSDQARYVTAQVTKGTITSSLSGTGQVAAISQVDIKPGASGQITSVRVKQGDSVKAGQVLATLDSRTAAAQLAQAQASVAQAQANYQKALNGATGSDLTAAQNAVTNARLSLETASTNAAISVANARQALAQAQADVPRVTAEQARAVSVAKINVFNASLAAQVSNSLSTATIALSGNYTGSGEGQYVISFYQTGLGTYYSAAGLGDASGSLQRGTVQPLGNGLFMTMSATGTLDMSTKYTIDVPNRAASGYTTAYNAYQSALENQTKALQDVQDALAKAQAAEPQAEEQSKNQIASAENQLAQAEQSLAEKISPADKVTLLSAQAALKQAQAGLVAAQTNYSNTAVVAPFDGIVAVLNAKVGDQAAAGAVLATLTTPQQVAEISLNEVDAAKVKVGQKAIVTFSAIDGLEITGHVGSVDLVGTVTQNIVSFKVKIILDTQDERIKPGMSVSVTVITDIKQDVLTAPSAAVKNSGGQSYVETLENGKPVRRQVTAGLSNDTDTEISGDIQEGESVITQIITNTTATKTTTQTSNGLIPGLGGGGGGVRVQGIGR